MSNVKKSGGTGTKRKASAAKNASAPEEAKKTLNTPADEADAREREDKPVKPATQKKILMVSSEADPFAKTGGLADVLASLPRAIAKCGCEARVILPKYGSIPEKYSRDFEFVTSFEVRMSWRKQYCGILKYQYRGIVFYFVDNEYYFGEKTIYHFYDRDIEKFSYFCRAVMEAIPALDFVPDIIHCHDWQTGMIPLLFDSQYKQIKFYSKMKTVYTIHNLQYQGIYKKDAVADFLEIPYEYLEQDKAGFFNQANFMKAGIVFGNIITTVSETYAQEIKYPFFGENLDGLLREKEYKLFGILNGVDYDVYNPAEDEYIYARYSLDKIEDVREGKAKNKAELQKEFGLEVRADVPLICIISRLINQKGLDLVDFVMDSLMGMDIQLIVLGTGDPKYENMFRHYATQYPRKVSCNIMFDDEYAHKMYAGCDMFLMPSLFEPCGMGQMIAARYGTLPVVREVGGLKDTISSFDEFSGEGNGFSFAHYNAHDMLYTITRAVTMYHDRETWEKVQQNALSSDFSWDGSAVKYVRLYKSLK